MRTNMKFTYILTTIALSASCCLANIINTVPYTNTFEAYPDGAQPALDANDGWYGISNSITITTNYANWTNGYAVDLIPVSTATHSRVAQITETVTNKIAQITTYETVYFDMTVLPTIWASETPPTNAGDEKFAIYFNANSNPVVRVGYPLDGAFNYTPQWLTLTNAPPISTSRWLRITACLDYGTDYDDGLDRDWIRLAFDGVECIDDRGCVQPETYSFPGPWFLCPAKEPNVISEVVFSGNLLLDDMVVQTNDPIVTVRYNIAISATPANCASVNPGPDFSSSRSDSWKAGDTPTYTFANKVHYSITNTCINGTNNIGTTSSYTFPAMTGNCSIAVYGEGDLTGLIISNTSVAATPPLSTSGYGAPQPPGSNSFTYLNNVTLSIAGSPNTGFGTHTQVACIGWTASGSPVNIGYTTNTTCSLQEYSTLTWIWDYQYLLETTVFGAGTVSPSNSWHFDNSSQAARDLGASSVELIATASADGFDRWDGDITGCTIVGNTLQIPTWDRPRHIEAHFKGGETTRGTAYDYMLTHYPTNYQLDVVENLDTDGDGFKTWEEYITGTDPTNVASKFQILSAGRGTNGSNFVSFYATTNSGVTNAFGMRALTDMTNSASWTNWTTVEGASVQRTVDGTNTYWYDPTISGANAGYYIPVATN